MMLSRRILCWLGRHYWLTEFGGTRKRCMFCDAMRAGTPTYRSTSAGFGRRD